MFFRAFFLYYSVLKMYNDVSIMIEQFVHYSICRLVYLTPVCFTKYAYAAVCLHLMCRVDAVDPGQCCGTCGSVRSAAAE